MDDRRKAILASIERAFEGVELGGGVSMRETEVIDDYGTAEQRRAAREPDEKLEWRKLIDDPDVDKYFGLGYCGLCFLDSEGVRFYLPACMARAIRNLDEIKTTGDMRESLRASSSC